MTTTLNHADGLKRIDPGNPQNSLLFLKVEDEGQ